MSDQKRYKVKELFLTVQGEGFHAGTPAIFVRFSGCNYWSGREEDRHTSSLCPFCDTDFNGVDGDGGGVFGAQDLVSAIGEAGPLARLVVLTGGEPLLQVDAPLVAAIKATGRTVAVETNGSVPLDEGRRGIDWVTCSPKSVKRLRLTDADEIKVVVPAQDPLAYMDRISARHLWVQPEDGREPGKRETSTRHALEFVQAHPGWRLSIQGHKYMGVP